ncbi:MAG: HAD family phosphatase [Acidimicrobiales bacterium]|nr:HAD family phosphatase [Acidimicrobiales bacterium]
MGRREIDAVVFDMGGVIVELGPLEEMLGDPSISAESFWPRWLASPAVRSFEMGRCTVTEFADALVAELGLTIAPADLIERFARWPQGLYPGAAVLVDELRAAGTVTAVMSNTNALHWERQRDAPQIRAMFEPAFLSYELGLAKPDAAAFEHVIAALDTEPGRIVFVDDNQVNVDAACAAGIDGVRALGPTEARAALAERGLVQATP